MKSLIHGTAALASACLVTLSAAQADPTVWLNDASVAMFGPSASGSTSSLVIRGTWGRTFGTFSIDGSGNIAWQSPDKFVEEEVQQMQSGPFGTATVTRRNGFNGDRRIAETISDMPMPDLPNSGNDAALLMHQRQRLVRLLLPLLASTSQFSSVYPLTIVSTEQTATANVIVMTGPDGVTLRLSLDPITKLPAMVTWTGRPTAVMSTSSTVVVPMGGRGVGGSPMQPPSLPIGDPTAGQPDVEYRMSLTGYRTEDGITWPRRFTTTVGGKTVEELRVRDYRVNATINPRTFR